MSGSAPNWLRRVLWRVPNGREGVWKRRHWDGLGDGNSFLSLSEIEGIYSKVMKLGFSSSWLKYLNDRLSRHFSPRIALGRIRFRPKRVVGKQKHHLRRKSLPTHFIQHYAPFRVGKAYFTKTSKFHPRSTYSFCPSLWVISFLPLVRRPWTRRGRRSQERSQTNGQEIVEICN